MTEKITAAVLTAQKKIEIKEFKKPKLNPKDFLMKVKYCGICGSDIHMWNGKWDPPYPIILGHEFIGEVDTAGSEALDWRSLRRGDQIAVEMIIPCCNCELCKGGNYNLCLSDDRSLSIENGVEYGCNISAKTPPSLWGGFSQYLYVPETAIVHRFDKKVNWKEAALTEPLAVSMRAVKRGNIQPGESVVIIGPGPIGLLSVVAAKTAGAYPIILTGTRDYRLKVGEALGADHIINITKIKDPIEKVKKLTNGLGASVVIETAGVPLAQIQSFKMAKKAGRVILVGLTGGQNTTLNLDEDLLAKELCVNSSYLSAKAYEDAIRIIQLGKFELNRIITNIYPLQEIEKAFQITIAKDDEVIKVLIDPWNFTIDYLK